jgi:hypothetical protein
MKKFIYTLSILAVVCSSSCKKFVDINTDPNNPLEVQEKLLLAPIEFNIVNNVEIGPDGSPPVIVNHYMQMVAYNQVIPNVGTYYSVNADFNNTWASIYSTCLQNLKILMNKGQANNNLNYKAIAEILTAHTLGIATDLWGDIPYSQALNGVENFTPAYDKQEDIYKEIQRLLDQGVTDIAANAGLKPGADDYFYAGDMAKWRKLAYTLKARYYMHLTKAPGYTAAAQADLALAALTNGLAANADDLRFVYPGGANSQNRWYTLMLPVTTLLASSAIVDTLVKRNDPRLPVLIAPAKNTLLYNGRPIGTPTLGILNNYSLLGSAYAGVASTQYLVPYTEALFLKAEATLIKSGFAAAQPIYQSAITTHMTKLGMTTPAINTYLAARGTLTATNALERIMEEKKIADFLSIENFNDWRRTGFPRLNAVANALSTIPRRMLYPQTEINTNPQPQQSAKLTDRVWWDAQ